MRGKSFGAAASPVQRIGAPSAGLASFRRIIAAQVGGNVSGAQSLVAPIAGIYRLALVGPGGQGGFSGTTGTCCLTGGGSGGLAVSKPFPMALNQAIAVNVGAAADPYTWQTSDGMNGLGPTTATLPDGTSMSATGGKGGYGRQNTSFQPGGAGGLGSGGEFNFPGITGGSAGNNGSALVGNGSGTESFNVDGIVITPTRVLSTGSFHQTNQVAAGGGANAPTGGFCPPLIGTSAAFTSFANPPSTNLIGVGTGGYWYNNGNNQIQGSRAGHGGAYLILEA